MSFVTHAACNGTVPRVLAGRSFFNRNSLLATMMRDREQIRYLVAPTGFGKSFLACSYASLVNDFRHTSWFDCENPCFLRDLDAHTLLPDILDATTQGVLVVFDNVPTLGAIRKAALWDMCHELVGHGREVIVCATPVAAPLQGHEKDCICIWPSDFLYTSADMDALRSIDALVPTGMVSSHPATRIPALISRSPDAFATFLAGHIEDLDNPVEAALTFVLLALERGTMEDVSMVLGRELGCSDLDVLRRRPFVVVDEFAEEFDARGFPLSEVLRAFSPHLAAIASSMGAEGSSEAILDLSSVLLHKGNADRAAKILITLCEPALRAKWLGENQQRLLSTCALVAAETVYDSLRSDRWRSIPALYAASCIRRSCLRCSDTALQDLVDVASKVEYALDLRLDAATYAYLYTEDIQLAKDLEGLFVATGRAFARDIAGLDNMHRALWEVWSNMSCDKDSYAHMLEVIPKEPSGVLACACLVHRVRLANVQPEAAEALGACVQEYMQECVPQIDFDTCALEVCLLRREIDAYGLVPALQDSTMLAMYRLCDQVEDALQVQQSAYAKAKVARAGAFATALQAQATRNTYAQRNIGHGATSGVSQGIPMMNVNLFGRFSVEVGDTVLSQHSFRRQKVRTLLALLVLESGHELACDNLAERLWPESDPVRGRHNLYNAISILRKGLSLADGSCPYLSRTHGVLFVNAALVESDVDMLAKLCHQLRFEDPDVHTCMHILEQVTNVYRGELLPAERDEPMIIAAREEWRNRLVNTLLYAAKRLVGMGDYVSAMQFAQRALACDPQREDCYEYLMALQARSGQRPAAIGTWMRYRHFVNDELGLDPSVRMSDLYARIISDAG